MSRVQPLLDIFCNNLLDKSRDCGPFTDFHLRKLWKGEKIKWTMFCKDVVLVDSSLPLKYASTPLAYTFRGVLHPSIVAKLKLIKLAIKWYQEFWNKMNCQFFSTSKCKHSNTLLKATSQSNFFWLIYFLPHFSDPKALSHIQFQRNVTNTFEKGLKKCGLMVQKLLSEKKTYSEITICRHVFAVLCHTSYCPNLGANEQIPFDL